MLLGAVCLRYDSQRQIYPSRLKLVFGRDNRSIIQKLEYHIVCRVRVDYNNNVGVNAYFMRYAFMPSVGDLVFAIWCDGFLQTYNAFWNKNELIWS